MLRRRFVEVFTEDVGMAPERYAMVRRVQRALAGRIREHDGGRAMTRPSSPRIPIFQPSNTAAVVRYQVQDLDRAVAFYTGNLGFQVTSRSGPIAVVSRGDLHLLFSRPASSGSRPMPDGRRQEPGGWNRIVLYVDDLDATIAALHAAGARFRNQVEAGPGGSQILAEDPEGNPVELHARPRE